LFGASARSALRRARLETRESASRLGRPR
jgi:hypothetical protein